MKSKELQSCLILLLAAAIWGFAFVAQQIGAAYVPTFEFNGVKFALGAMTLLPVILFNQKKFCGSFFTKDQLQHFAHHILPRGAVMGLVLFFASWTQQFGIVLGSTAGKAGFITGLYTVLVPLLAMFLGKRTHMSTWVSAILAAAGIFLISVKGNFTISTCDLFELIGAVLWAVHILVTGRFSKQANAIGLAVTQFTVCAILNFLCSPIFEHPTVSGLQTALIPVLYGGILSAGIAFTLQIVGQRHARPAHSAIIMSMESLFAALGGFLILGENLGVKGYAGCALMIVAIILSQISSFRRQPDEHGKPISH